MNFDTFPPSRLSHLVRRVDDSPPPTIHRKWTGNDDFFRNYHCVVNLNQSPLRLKLLWKESSNASSHLVGIFDLDLRRLVEENYVRLEQGVEGAVRLRFYHGLDNIIYIQVNQKGPALPVGMMH
jgi:hypothetical protein